MAKKKVMLFIVEGPTDETSLSTVLNRIFSSSTVKFQVVHGDILTRDFTSSDKIVAAVWEQVKEFMGSIYRKSDIAESFISPIWTVYSSLMMLLSRMIRWKLILHHTIQKCKFKRQIAPGFLTATSANGTISTDFLPAPKVAGIPYSMYYFSLNLDHILHGRTNLSNWEKIRCAEEFDLKYGDDPDGFTLFMKESSFSVCDDYRRSWAFIKTELHSLERYSNFGIELPPRKTATLQPNR